MQFDAQCIDCLVHRQRCLAEERGEPEKTYQYLRQVLQIILDAPAGVAAPYLTPRFADAFAKFWPKADHYGPLKEESNREMLAHLPEMEAMVAAAEDPLLMALKLAQTGNYIDYGAISVDMDTLSALLAKAPENIIDPVEYGHFCEDLSKARRMLYIGDNAGEIVADRVAVEQLRARYPDLQVTFAVRGGDALNDATREDAAASGMDQVASIVDNGSRISGTELSYLGDEMKRALAAADVILAKGQGNFETLLSCGYNVYYLFLCKCKRFTERFHVPKLTGMFLNERRVDFGTPFC